MPSVGLQIRTKETANLPITTEIGNAVRMAAVIAGFNIIAAQLAVCDASVLLELGSACSKWDFFFRRCTHECLDTGIEGTGKGKGERGTRAWRDFTCVWGGSS